jgi:hypothetical protein
MNTYSVKFTVDNPGITESYVRKYKANDPGHAFERCRQEYPKARLIKAWREGSYLDGYGITTYEPPSTVKVEAEPAPREEQMRFPFDDLVRSVPVGFGGGRSRRTSR